MKPIKFLFIVLLFLGCSSDDDGSCSCVINIIAVDDPFGVIDEYTISDVPNTCNNQFNNIDNFNDFREEENIPENHWFSSATNCK